MAARAFIIAIEDYSRGKYLPSLKGCNRDAETFIQWLLEKKLKDVKSEAIPDFIRCCSGKDVENGKDLKWRTTGTTSNEIIAELGRCVTDWADKTDEFYFYFSGHGFSYSTSPWEKSVDVLVCSDFTDLATGGRACLQLSEIKVKLWKALGPRHHYYFIDACRNQIPSDKIAPATTGLGFADSQLGTPSVYKMFSTAQGALSKTTSGFTPMLVKGLEGSGRSKGLRSGRMYVIFDLLCEYMKKNLQASGQDVDYDREGSGEGYLLELKPIPKSKCEITVDNAKEADKFTLIVSDIKGLEKEHQFKGKTFEVSLFPDDYFLEVKHPSATIVQKEPPAEEPVDLYDPCVVHFELREPPVASSKALSLRGKPLGATRTLGVPLGLAGPGRPAHLRVPRARFNERIRVPQVRVIGVDGEHLGVMDTRDALGAARENGLDLVEVDTTADPPLCRIIDFGKFQYGARKKANEAKKKRRPKRAASPRSMTGILQLKAAPTPHTKIELLNLKTGDLISRTGAFNERVPTGDYIVKLRERGITVSRRELSVKSGEKTTLKLLDKPTDRIRGSILKAAKAEDNSGAAVFSETALGPLASQDLGLWLSLFGASRILGQFGEFKKLERLPLEKFNDVKKDESVVYVLAGFEKSVGSFGIGLSSGARVKWEVLPEVKGLHRIYERKIPAATGSHLLSLKVPAQLPKTFAIHCLPNRATLVVLAEDKEGWLVFHQFLLPLRHLAKHLDSTVQYYLNRNMLSVVRTITLAHNQFARNRSVQEQMQTADAKVWNSLFHNKWLDPMMAIMAAYDLIRHLPRAKAKKELKTVNHNLRRYFDGMADVEAIAKLLGTEWQPPSTPPLFLDGVLAFDDIQEKQMFPLAPEKLDYKSPWTAWRGAVSEFKTPKESARRRNSSGAAKPGKRTRKTAGEGAKKKTARGRKKSAA